MTSLPKNIIIDEYAPNDDGEVWFHLGNMYWCEDYDEFYRYMNTKKSVVSEDDFPHDYFRFKDPLEEASFRAIWASSIQKDKE